MPRGSKEEPLEEWSRRRQQEDAEAVAAANHRRAERIREIESERQQKGSVEDVAPRTYHESWEEYQERTVDRKKLRDIGKQVRREFTDAIQGAGGDEKAQAISTNKAYKAMGDRPSGKDRGGWSIEEQERCAVTEHWSAGVLRFVFGYGEKPETQNDQTQTNAQIIDTVSDAAQQANDLMNDPDSGMGGVSGIFGWFFGDNANKDNPPPPPEPEPVATKEPEGDGDRDDRDIVDKTLDFLYKIF
jgi:hypothetical protein